MDFLRLLRVFVTVAEAGSFARAAEALRMTRPAVTAAIGSLEKTVGARLLQRTTRRTSVTGEGAELLLRANRLLQNAEETRNLFGGSDTAPRGRLRVDIAVALARPVIIPALPEFRTRYPGVEIVLGVSDQPVDLVADGVDCVVRIGALPPSSMIARTVARITMILCGSPDYLARMGTPATAEDLREHVAVNYFSGKAPRPLDWSLPECIHNGSLRLPSAVLINDSEGFVGCALENMGLIQVPALFVEKHLRSGRLVQVLPTITEVEWPVSVMYPNREYLAPQVRAFIDWVVALLAAKQGRWLHPA